MLRHIDGPAGRFVERCETHDEAAHTFSYRLVESPLPATNFLASDADPINDPARPGWLAIPGKAAADEVLAAARLTDGRMARVSDDLVTAIVGADRLRAIDRSVHRHEHLDQIERALTTH